MKNIKLNEAPPIKDRPRCPQCNRPLRPRFETVKHERMDHPGRGFSYQDTVEWKGDYHGYGAFDTMRCAMQFAIAAFKAGYRRRTR